MRSIAGAIRRRRSARRSSLPSMARRRFRRPSESIRSPSPSRRQEMSAKHREMLETRIAELKSRIGEGGLREAAIRGLLYVGSARGMVDERSLEALRNVRRNDKRCAADAGRVQDAGPRAILHAAAGPGRERWPPSRSCCPTTPTTGARLSPRSARCCPQAPRYRVRSPAACSVSPNCSASMRRKCSERTSNVAPFDPRRRLRNEGWTRSEQHHERHGGRFRAKRVLPASMTV